MKATTIHKKVREYEKRLLEKRDEISDELRGKESRIVTKKDWFNETKARFVSIFKKPTKTSYQYMKRKWGELKKKGFEHYESEKSCSEYLTDHSTGNIYRFSDHWGDVASCRWVLYDSEYNCVTEQDYGFRYSPSADDRSYNSCGNIYYEPRCWFNIFEKTWHTETEMNEEIRALSFRKTSWDIGVCNIKDFVDISSYFFLERGYLIKDYYIELLQESMLKFSTNMETEKIQQYLKKMIRYSIYDRFYFEVKDDLRKLCSKHKQLRLLNKLIKEYELD